jgi:hypothetical protein
MGILHRSSLAAAVGALSGLENEICNGLALLDSETFIPLYTYSVLEKGNVSLEGEDFSRKAVLYGPCKEHFVRPSSAGLPPALHGQTAV